MLVIFAVLLSLASNSHTLAQQPVPQELLALENKLIELTAKAERSVVAITRLAPTAERPLPIDLDPFEAVLTPNGPNGFVPGEFGTGVIIASGEDEKSRFILTNHHVVTAEVGPAPSRDGSKIWIRTHTRHTLPAEIHAFDPRSDLAVLRVVIDSARTGLSPDDVPPIPFGAAEPIRKGQLVLALGNPYAIARDGSCSVSFGMISNIGRRSAQPPQDQATFDDEQVIHHYGTLLHVDTRLQLGTSGGALVSLEGRLVGLTTSLAALQGYDHSAGFAIPIDDSTKRIIKSLLKGVEVEYGFLGITPDDALPEDLRIARPFVTQPSAARVGRVAADSPAERAGLQSGDVVLSVDGRTVYNGDDLIREVGLLGPDAQAELWLWRSRTREFLRTTVRLGKWPVHDDSRIVASNTRYPGWRGLHVDYPTARRRYMPSTFLGRYFRAVVVTNVEPESPAARAGLEPGLFIAAVDGQPVETPAQFYSALPAGSATVELTLIDGSEKAVSSR